MFCCALVFLADAAGMRAAASPNPVSAAAALSGDKPQQPVMARPDPKLPQLSAAEIIERNVAARGGLVAWKRVQSMVMSGKIDAGRPHRVDRGAVMGYRDQRAMTDALEKEAKRGEVSKSDPVVQLPFVLELQRPRKMRFELQFRGETAIQVYDGERGWKLRPYLNRHDVEPFTPEELKIAAQQQDLDGPLIDYAAKGNKVELAGSEWVEDRPAYKLKVTLKTGDVRNVWVDGQSFLDIKIDGAPRRLDGRYHPVLVYQRDYRQVDGLLVPYLLETAVEGVHDTEKIHVEKVTVNPPLDAARFAKPH